MSTWDKYKSPHEPEHHWILRKKFLETHQDKYSIDRLLCLAQVFYNIEFLGCKYPDKVMKLIEELSKGVADEHREEKKSKIQRTFVGASEAAESKVCRTGIKRKSDININQDESEEKRQCFSTGNNDNLIDSPQTSSSSLVVNNMKLDFNIVKSYLNRNPPLSSFILVMMKDELTLTKNTMYRSTKFSKTSMKFDTKIIEPDKSYKVSLSLGPNNQYIELVSIITNNISKTNMKSIKLELLNLAYEKFKQDNFIIIINNRSYSSQSNIEKKNEKEKQSIEQKEEIGEIINETEGEEKKESNYISDNYEQLAEDNIGSKLLKLMGWSGSGGLGKNQQGIAEPVPITGRLNRIRKGLGKDNEFNVHSSVSGEDGEQQLGLNVTKTSELVGENFKNWVRNLLTEYLNNEKLLWFEDLIFSTSFNKEERSVIHNICQSYKYRTYLMAKSYGKGEVRYLVISRKINKDGYIILYDLLTRGDNPKFQLIIPENFQNYYQFDV